MQGATLFRRAEAVAFVFQSTLPMQGATITLSIIIDFFTNFNPRSLCRERLFEPTSEIINGYISIHAPYAGSDGCLKWRLYEIYISIHAPYAGSDDVLLQCIEVWRFQSTLPMQGAT